jgi:predicted  nucleic acid-binding Zn-ribbon protein
MTSETRTFIGAADISGVEIECTSCHLTIFYPVTGERAMDILAGCPHCSKGLFDEVSGRTFGDRVFPVINELQKLTSALRALLRPDRTDIHANIRFRIDTAAGGPTAKGATDGK